MISLHYCPLGGRDEQNHKIWFEIRYQVMPGPRITDINTDTDIDTDDPFLLLNVTNTIMWRAMCHDL